MARFTRLTLALALVLALPMPALAQAKIRIAIWDFDNNAANHGWDFFSKLGPAARDDIDNAFGKNDQLSNMFSVIERDKLALVMKEQGLSTSGAVDPQTQAKIGKILGVKYILTGAIDKFDITTTRGGIGGIGGQKTTCNVTINVRLIDTTTAERIVAVSGDGKIEKGGAHIGSANLSSSESLGVASDAIQKAADNLIQQMLAGNALSRVSAAAGSTGGIDARIARVDGTSVYLNIGAQAGIKVGDTFRIFQQGEKLIDPATGADLGSTEKQTGTCTVTTVQDKFAVATLTGTATVGAVIRK